MSNLPGGTSMLSHMSQLSTGTYPLSGHEDIESLCGTLPHTLRWFWKYEWPISWAQTTPSTLAATQYSMRLTPPLPPMTSQISSRQVASENGPDWAVR